ncbi:MAG: class I SAM-dependent methyltransferase [bacterium]|nr:class I SAM-dependent methyltransferase [bacterium]
MEQNNFKCYFCGSSKKQSEIEIYIDNGIKYALYECSDCGVQYWTPFKNPGAEWYEKDLRYAGRNIDPDFEPNWHQKKAIKFLGSLTGSLLDIGCGAGTFIYWASKKGWDVFGIDFDRDAINTAMTVFKLNKVYAMDLAGFQLKFSNLKFNFITFFDVFEHLDNHHDFLEQVKNALVPSGYIAMSMPYRKGARWLNSGDLPPRHLTRWDRSTITDYLKKNGFEVVYIRRLSEGLGYIVTKLRRKYGTYFSMNIIGRLKNRSRKNGKIELNSKAEKIISRVHNLARIKDWIVFGFPAMLIWLTMLFTSKRYITLFVIARKRQ